MLRRVPLWTREGIIAAILARELDDAPLGSRSLRPRSLADAGARIFGSWRAALAAAGVQPRRRAEWTCRVSRNTNGRLRAEQDSQRGRSSGGALRLDIAGTAETAGVLAEPERVRPNQIWTRQGVVDAIRARLREHKPMNANAVYQDHRSLYRGGERRLGNWRKALQAAGLNPDEFQKGNGGRAARH